jgi:hypothetical protein
MIYLAERVDARSKDITEALQISFATFQRAVPELYVEDYLDHTKVGSKNVCRYFLTEDGVSVAKRLIRYRLTEGQIVQPRTINKLQGTYIPSNQAYYRNDGHAHLQSRGF